MTEIEGKYSKIKFKVRSGEKRVEVECIKAGAKKSRNIFYRLQKVSLSLSPRKRIYVCSICVTELSHLKKRLWKELEDAT
jgi:hypothetical protein